MSPTTLPGVWRQSGLQGRHVLIGMVAFFGIVFAVNGLLLYHALATHSGIVAQEPYRKGLAYNTRIAADERQAALGWSADVTLEHGGRVALTLAGSDGAAIAARSVVATIGRPTSNREDRRMPLVEVAHGRYTAELGAVEPGAWLVDIEVRNDRLSDQLNNTGTPEYRMRRRLWLKP